MSALEDSQRDEIRELNATWARLNDLITKLDKENDALRAKLDKATAALEKFLRQNRDCPLCAMFESAQVILTELKA